MLESRLAAWSPAAPSVTGASNFRCIIRNREVVEKRNRYKFYLMLSWFLGCSKKKKIIVKKKRNGERGKEKASEREK